MSPLLAAPDLAPELYTGTVYLSLQQSITTHAHQSQHIVVPKMFDSKRNTFNLLSSAVLLISFSSSTAASFVIHPHNLVAKIQRSIHPSQSLGGSHQDVTTPNDDNVDWSSLQELSQCQSGSQARRILESILMSNLDDITSKKPLYKSISIPRGASDRPISDGDLAIQTKVRNKKYSITELIELSGDSDVDRASLAVLGVTVGSVATALVADQNLPGPEILRFVVVWLLSFAPLALVGSGIADPEQLQTFLVSVQRNIFPTYRTRMIQHEAGHFLIGHLLGVPIKGYQANAVKSAVEFYPLNDAGVGRDRANQLGFDSRRDAGPQDSFNTPRNPDAPYFSKEGRGSTVVETRSVFRNVTKDYSRFLKLPIENEPTAAWPFRGFDHETIDKLAVISVAGVCAEILAFGNAEGGIADLSQLRQIFASAQPELTQRDMDNRIRFALGYTMSLLRLNLGVLDALATVMERGGSVAECVRTIETHPNVSGQDGILGDYEQRRKLAFRSKGIGFLERLLLGGDKNADTEEDRLVDGKGGGYRKESFQLSGDDPLYIALFLSTTFFVWASTGGVSLH